MADDSTSSSTPSFPKLCSSNYSTWKGEMKAFLCTKSLWTIVSGAEKCPDDSKADLQAKWDIRADKAAGQLYLLLSAEQRTHIDAVQDDPAQIWSTLESIHLQQRPGAWFNAWDDFFSIRKKQDESLTSLIARIEDSMSKIQQLRPKDASSPYTIKGLDNELICMAMVGSMWTPSGSIHAIGRDNGFPFSDWQTCVGGCSRLQIQILRLQVPGGVAHQEFRTQG